MTSETITVDTSSAIALTNQAKAAAEGATDIIIDSPDMLQLAGEELRQVKALQKQVEDQRTSITKPLNDALKAVNALFKAPAEFLTRAETIIKFNMVEYTEEQERIARIERQKAEAAAQAERSRLAEEARAAAEEASKALAKAQAAAAAGDARSESQALQQAAEAQAAAEVATMTAEVITFTPAVAAPAKVEGISGRVTYSAEVTDLLALVKAVAAGVAPIEAIAADVKFLGAQARAFKKSGPLYPGVTVKAERSISARSA